MISPILGAASEVDLAALASALGARKVRGWSVAETKLLRNTTPPAKAVIDIFRRAIKEGLDPLGDAFCMLRSPETRRPLGATYTPKAIVNAMLKWSCTIGRFERVIDPGTGSGRYLIAASKRLPEARLLGIEVDPLAAMVSRANLATLGLEDRSEIQVREFQSTEIPNISGRTLWIGNPPYVRHHLISHHWKSWLAKTATTLGLDSSQLAGLHVHFYLATALKAKDGDAGCFITAAEWLDVNYGKLLRQLFLSRLGGKNIHVLEPTVLPFTDALTTATITCFEIAAKPPSIKLKRHSLVSTLDDLNDGHLVRRERLDSAGRWTPLTRPIKKKPEGFIELGELCRVHRGQVTGANDIWIAGEHSSMLPESVLYPSVTRARELFQAGDSLKSHDHLRRVIDLPVELDRFPKDQRRNIDRFLRFARTKGVHRGYIAKTRKAWWSVELREPAKIIASYMARRPPIFVRNLAGARHINIAHGLYPRETMSEPVLEKLASFLSKNVALSEGRTYGGGLTKFEPREMERLLVPDMDTLLKMPT